MFGLESRAPKPASSCLRVTFGARSLESMDRKKAYFLLMGTCILLILLAWNVVRFWSTTAAVVMSVIAAVIPPVAVIVGNWGQDRQ
jgi:Ca2+/Na+ antiporter